MTSKKTTQRQGFRTNEFIVYPSHGVGQILAIEEQEVAGAKLELFVITFEKDKMTLRVPTMKAKAVGMRKLSSPDVVATALNTLKGRARIKRTMWSRRAQEYEAKINSGDLVSIAEVVRDLYRASGQPEQSYSERQLYEAALARMAREVAAVERIDVDVAQRIPRDRVDREVATPGRLARIEARIADHLEPLVSATDLRFAAGQRDVEPGDLVDGEALADGVDAAEPGEERLETRGLEAVDLDVDVLAVGSSARVVLCRRPAAS